MNNQPSSLAQISRSTPIVTTTDGTQVRYDWKGGAFRCNQIKDRNGNYITVTHNTNGLLTKVTDTLARDINVSYDSGDSPIAITQTWSTGTHTWATFSYGTKEVDTNFDSSLTIFGPPNTTVLKVLDKITFADGSNTRFLYNSYAQVSRVENYAPDNHELNHVITNLASIPAGAQSDCPRATDTYSWVEGFHGVNGVPSWTTIRTAQSTETTYNSPDGSGTIPVKAIKVWMDGHPDYLYSKIYFGNSGWNNGLQIATEDCLGDPQEQNCSNQKRWTWTKWDQDRWDETYAPYIVNPRIVETRVGDSSNTKRSTVTYHTPPDQMPGNIAYFGLVDEVKIYENLSTVIKKTKTAYNLDAAYLNRYIIGLAAQVEAWGNNDLNQQLEPASKVTYAYDQGDLTGADPVQNISPVQHDNTNYGSSFNIGRGNLTSTTRWDVPDQTSEVTSSIKYNTAGSPVARIDPLGRITRIGYADNFNSTVGVATYAYPTVVTDAAGSLLGDADHSSFVRYRYDIGANVEAVSPAPNGSPEGGKRTSRIYDSVGRIQKEIVDYTGAYTRYDYGSTGKKLTTYTTIVDDEVATETHFDGAGRVMASRTENPNSTGGFMGKRTIYDLLGRAIAESVPTEINSSWNPAGDDYRGMNGSDYIWLWNIKEFDWKGRVKRSIPSDSNGTDGKDTLITYEGCGCAGGQITTIKGPKVDAYGVTGTNLQLNKRRTQKVYEDILGRSWKTEILDLDGNNPSAPYSTTKTYFNGRDQATRIRQYAGSEFSSTFQETTVDFDGHGRPWRAHKPEWVWYPDPWTPEKRYTTTTYNADDTVATVTDPRGVETTYTYGGPSSVEKRPLVTNIVYAAPSPNPTPGATPNPFYIPPTSSVSFEYDAIGNRKKMTDGTGTLEYSYDPLSRLVTETKEFVGAEAPQGTYALTYEYHLSGGVKSITGPHDFNATYSVDQIGRITGIENAIHHSEYLSGISYRAFGAMKSMNIATTNPIDVEMTYDEALRPSTYYAHNAVGGNPVTIQKAAYSYGNDGKVKEIDNQRNGVDDTTFDQRNVYDFAGRLKKNSMGQNDATFKQTLAYNAFNGLTSRDNYFYSYFDNYTTPNNKRDKAGNVVEDISSGVSNQQPEPGGGRPYTDTKTWNYDAAGRMSSWYEEGPWGSNIKGETLFYDGDGRPVGKSVIWHYTPQFEYYSLVSSVTGKRVLDVMASGSTSEPFGVQVYLGDTLIYDETYRGESDSSTVYGLGYRLTDPISGSLQQIHADGSIPSQTTYPYARVELAGLGTSVPLEAPQTFPEIDYSSGGFPGNAGSGCSNIRLDGFEVGPGMCDTAKWMLGHGMATIDWERSDSWALSRMGIMAVHHQFETPDGPSTPDDPNTPEDEGIERVGSTADWWEYKVWGNPQIGLRVPPQGIIGQAVNDVRAILSGDNDCSKFFGLSGPIYGRIADRVDEIIGETERLNVLPVLDALSGQLRPGFLVGDLNNTTIGIRMTSRPGRGIDVQSGQLRFRIFENATVNNRGPFMRTGTFGNYTGRAGRALAILHEMAHMIRTGQVRDSNGRVVGSAYLIPDDGAATNQSETNTALIEEKCKKELDLIGR